MKTRTPAYVCTTFHHHPAGKRIIEQIRDYVKRNNKMLKECPYASAFKYPMRVCLHGRKPLYGKYNSGGDVELARAQYVDVYIQRRS